MSVSAEERHTKAHPCPVCGGHQGMPSGKGIRCAGYTSADGKWAFCTRVSDGAHHEVTSAALQTWAHLLKDDSQINGSAGGFFLHGAASSTMAPLPNVDQRKVQIVRRMAQIELALKALDVRAESAQSEAQYEVDRVEYNGLWDELEVLDTELKKLGMNLTPDEPKQEPEVSPWVELERLVAPLPPIEWLCEGMKLAPGAVSCFSGYGYSGKTALAQAFLLAVANGRPFLDVMRCGEGLVGHLDYEQGFRLSVERMQRLCRGMGLPLEQGLRNVRFCPFPEFYVDDQKGRDAICRAVDGLKTCLIDSGRASMPGIEENDSKSRIHIDALSRISEKTGVAFLMVLHDGKLGAQVQGQSKAQKERTRGSSAMYDAMQTVWGFEKKDTEEFVRAVLRKDRLTGDSVEFGFKFQDSMGPKDAPDSWLKLIHLEPEQMVGKSTLELRVDDVVQSAMAQPGLNKTKLASLVKGKTALTYTAIDLAVESGRLALIGGTYRAV